jgi:hypothetical protein
MNLNPISVAEALPIVADEMGIDLDNGREEALLWLNRIRSLWYHSFQKRALFDDLVECVPLSEQCAPCLPCGGKYTGFTIPHYMSGPVTAWASTEPVVLRSRWFEKYTGRHAGSEATFQSTPIPGTSPTECDILRGTRISVTAMSRKDDGKKMIIKGLDCHGDVRTLCATLVGDAAVESEFELSSITSIVLPKLSGELVLRSEIDGRVLSTYNPAFPTVPEFRRFKADYPCSGLCSIYVRANRRYRDLYADSDIVEIGDRLVLEHGASSFRFGKNTTDTKELQRAAMDRAEMINLIAGMVQREDGGHAQDGPIAIRGRRTRRATLPGYDR